MNNIDKLFNQFLITDNIEVSLVQFVINLFLASILSLILEWSYYKCAKTVSNRKIFANNFILLALTTMTIITIVKSSLALSLGLVGALSIVRFRSAIKEPEELVYLFLSIAIGLGFGANQRDLTIIAFIFIEIIIWIKNYFSINDMYNNMYLTVNIPNDKIELNVFTNIITKYFLNVDLKRYDKEKGNIEIVFSVEINEIVMIDTCESELRKINKNIKISYLDNRGLI